MSNSSEPIIWRVHPDCEYVEVSSRGDVRSLPFVDARGNRRAERMRRPSLRSDGYFRVRVNDLPRLVHNLVLEAFVGPRPPGMDGMHLDANRANNRLENLRWGTSAENAQQRVTDGNHDKANATHCPKGHEYSEENTYRPTPNHRVCRQCRRVGRTVKTHCPMGHPYDESNTYHYQGRRSCITCKTERSRAARALKRQAVISRLASH